MQKAIKKEYPYIKIINNFCKEFSSGNSLDLSTVEGSFDQCLNASCELYKRLSKIGSPKIKICIGYIPDIDGDASEKYILTQCNKKDFIHYCVEFEGSFIDVTARQFDSLEDFPKICSGEEMLWTWSEIRDSEIVF